MKKTAVFTSFIFAATLMTAGGALATGDEKYQEKDKDQYGATSSQMTTDQSSAASDSKTMGQDQSQQDQGIASVGATSGQKQKIESANDLQGAKVQNAQGEQLGEISQLLIDVDKGKVGYAVVKSGGVMGMGEEKFIVPFNALKAGEGNTLVLNMNKDQLKQAPQGDVQQVLDQEKGRQIHQFYGVSPYWEEGSQQQSQEGTQSDMFQQDQSDQQQDQMDMQQNQMDQQSDQMNQQKEGTND